MFKNDIDDHYKLLVEWVGAIQTVRFQKSGKLLLFVLFLKKDFAVYHLTIGPFLSHQSLVRSWKIAGKLNDVIPPVKPSNIKKSVWFHVKTFYLFSVASYAK